ncbi:hypothetical protein [Tahibacter amnicola]|uniref:Uncharacterized protein n=1 Tax=Tahibacter amnicola TaxID=2976241 RepID=A0ABY6BDR9_9GAMM|nr:hypothetical protein [Tahibacter amnicola]UXI67687.1 hypothetical protein N4264_23595 [Tahibacter amnicola]
MFYPGAELALMSAGLALVQACGITLAALTPSQPPRHYAIPLDRYFTCAISLGLFSSPLPAQDIQIQGVHWFVEGVGTSGRAMLTISQPEVSLFSSSME